MRNKLPILPEKLPAEGIWAAIEQGLGANILKDSLPTHEPSGNLWNNIKRELDSEEILRKLPTHNPSNKVWEKITVEKTTRTLKLNWWLIAAASVSLMIGLSYVFQNNTDKNPSSELSYSEVWVYPTQLENWDLESDHNIEELISLLESENPDLLNSSEYLELKTEFTTLVQSKNSLLEEISPYNDNLELETILTRIELEKNELVRNLIAYSHV